MSDNGEKLAAARKRVAQALEKKLLSPESAKNILRWLEPPYREYHDRLVQLLETEQFTKLEEAFWTVIPFGTGGRRGVMGELGTATVNARTIAESAQGMADYLRQVKPGKNEEGFAGVAVVAHDTRNHSREFAELTAATFAANGLKVYCFESHRSTPELSFAVRYLQCDIGAMISASHNPPSDNGFKAYWSNGAQVLPPHDAGIIQGVEQAGEIPVLDFQQAVRERKIEIIGDAVDQVFFRCIRDLSLSDARDIRAIFTPLHGVGETSVYNILRDAGFAGVSIFEPQRAADGNFTNVPDRLPNPERTEVFGPAIEEAQQTGAELVLASDPDADRIGVCVRNQAGKFVHLTGNQVGALLVDYILRKRSDLTSEHYVIETMVTTPLISRIGKARGLKVVDNLLVGFKYIGETIDQLGPDKFVFGAEESLGYLAGQYARDKDAGISALYVMELAAELKQEGKTLLDRLHELYAKHDYHLESQVSKTCKGPTGQQQITQIMDTFRAAPPQSLGGCQLVAVKDYGQHETRSLPANKKTEDLPSPHGDLLFLESAANDAGFSFSLAVRPSGTEPKIKFYFFARAKCPDPAKIEQVMTQAGANLKQVETELSAWADRVITAT